MDSLSDPEDEAADGDDEEAALLTELATSASLDEELLEQFALPTPPVLGVRPRPYQQDAVRNWLANAGRGVVVLPTGSGKTVVALMALEQVPVRTLVIVPTIELLRQWHDGIIRHLGLPADLVGVVGGGERRLAPVTIMTYDSAAMPQRALADYGLLVVDEVHHLPAPTYRRIVAKTAAPWRLGLSATPERADGRHDDLATLVGPEVYRKEPAQLSQEGHIAAYRQRRVFVDLIPQERYRYDALMAEYKWFLATRRSQFMHGNLFDELIRRSAFDPAARRALQAHHQARLIALNAEGKIESIAQLLQKHRDAKVLVFSEYTAMVTALSRRLALPAITYRTDAEERRLILERFRAGRYSKLASGRVLNEGVDVPDANVAIVASGSSSKREHIQRLGRVLRPKPGEAVLYEIISRHTTEGRASRNRREGAA